MLLIAPLLVYKFLPSSVENYNVGLTVAGEIPIMGLQQGEAQVNLKLQVKGGEREGETMGVSYELTDGEVQFNRTKLSMVTLDNFKEFFPRTILSVAPTGRVVRTDAKTKKLPIRLPGLDQKRLPEITFLAVELPSQPMEPGMEWTYRKSFGESDVAYTCHLNELSGDKATIAVKVKQDFEYDENESHEVVTDKADAAEHVVTSMNGEGTVVFSVGTGAVDNVDITNLAVSDVVDVASKEKSTRRITSHLVCSRDGAGLSTVAVRPSAEVTTWDQIRNWSINALSRSKFALSMLRAILVQAFSSLMGGAPIRR